ncbi:MAG: IS4-like element ISSod3 family transposase [Gammaproteobacteria bacterium]|nr:MAG: IS4-like element ISSod3 family transposase [Gammaproteobacteria bacterium]
MHATHVLNNHLQKMCQGIHKVRRKALMSTVTALIQGKKLSVTGLGRSMPGEIDEKHQIKKADRLIGNPYLNQQRHHIYAALVKLALGKCCQPVIHVDWSALSPDREFHWLRATVPAGGRALPVYEESHRQANYADPQVEERFLRKLKAILPAGCCPIIVTDAGFRNPWFRSVQAMGWDFVGRVGRHAMVSPQGEDAWEHTKEILITATGHARYQGYIDLVRNKPLACHAYLLKKKKQGRIKKNNYGERCASKHSKKNAHRERTPWLIVTSLTGGTKNTKRVINIYKTRMQIEEAFRDMKNSRWGFSLREARSTTTYRYENLMLVGTLATFAIWLIGKVAELKQWQYRYQANTTKTRNVLSTFFLGCQVFRKSPMAKPPVPWEH